MDCGPFNEGHLKRIESGTCAAQYGPPTVSGQHSLIKITPDETRRNFCPDKDNNVFLLNTLGITAFGKVP